MNNKNSPSTDCPHLAVANISPAHVLYFVNKQVYLKYHNLEERGDRKERSPLLQCQYLRPTWTTE